LKFDLVVAIFSNLIANDYKLHVVINGLVTFWLISTSVINEAKDLVFGMKLFLKKMGIIVLPIIPTKMNDHELVNILK
jgi:hypothetical protein